MRHEFQAEGFSLVLRPVCLGDSAFITWLRNLNYVKGYVGDSASDAPSQEAWLGRYFERVGDYYFVIESAGGIPLGTEALYNNAGSKAEWGRFIVRPETLAAVPAAQMIDGKPVDLVEFIIAVEDWRKVRDRLLPLARQAGERALEWEKTQSGTLQP